MNKIQCAIMNFRETLASTTGDDQPVLSITLSKNAAFRLKQECAAQMTFIARGSFDMGASINFCGIEIVDSSLESK